MGYCGQGAICIVEIAGTADRSSLHAAAARLKERPRISKLKQLGDQYSPEPFVLDWLQPNGNRSAKNG